MDTKKDRVGGRPGSKPPAPGGGGYPDICSDRAAQLNPAGKILAKKIGLTITDLESIGIRDKWLEVAKKIGVEKFIDIWEILDRENIDQPPASRDTLRIRVPSFSKLIKFTRNRRIEELIDKGLDNSAIAAHLHRERLEPISKPRISQLRKTVK